MMSRIFQIVIATLFLSFYSADSYSEVLGTESLGQITVDLDNILTNLETIKQHCHTFNLDHIQLLEEAVVEARNALRLNPVNNLTRNLLFVADTRVNARRFLFRFMTTDRSAVAIAAVLNSSDSISKVMGFREVPLSQVYSTLLTQLDDAFFQLVKIKDVDDKLRNIINESGVRKKIFDAAAIAGARGDSGSVIIAAGQIYCDVLRLYGPLDSFSLSKVARPYVIEIKMLNEEIGRIGEFNPTKCGVKLESVGVPN